MFNCNSCSKTFLLKRKKDDVAALNPKLMTLNLQIIKKFAFRNPVKGFCSTRSTNVTYCQLVNLLPFYNARPKLP